MLLPDGCPQDLQDELKKRFARWGEVDKMLAILTRLRMAERERHRALEVEVEDLSNQIKVRK